MVWSMEKITPCWKSIFHFRLLRPLYRWINGSAFTTGIVPDCAIKDWLFRVTDLRIDIHRLASHRWLRALIITITLALSAFVAFRGDDLVNVLVVAVPDAGCLLAIGQISHRSLIVAGYFRHVDPLEIALRSSAR